MNHPDPSSWLDGALEALASSRVTVFGDFCLDAYWLIDEDLSELSIETALPVHRVRAQRYSLGGAGNVVANLVDLGVGTVRAVGLAGDDLFGRQMRALLAERGVHLDGMLVEPAWQSLVYAKPCLGERELNRLDFGAVSVPAERTLDALAGALHAASADSDVVILNQQVPAGASPPAMIERINAVVAGHPACRFIVDSRHRAECYRGAMLKLNAHEALRLLGRPRDLQERIPAADARAAAGELARRTGQNVFVTRGGNGLVIAQAQAVHDVPGIQVLGAIDPVGAGDTVVAALAAALAGGCDALTAARLANIAASVTVRKLQTTGTANPAEIRAVGPQPDYVYLPELADDPRSARYVGDTEIEQVRPLPGPLAIRHAIFDHDGTISTLRQGWEQIMAPMMVRAILGPRYRAADEGLYHRVVEEVGAFIDRTTGVQTLAQMQGLVEMVHRFRCVAPADILDIHGYKALYDRALKDMVRRRIAKLDRGELSAEDFQIKGARILLERLHAAGVTLYLASGTDTADVAAEAEALGYAGLFAGRVFGAVGDVTVEAKRLVLEAIFRDHGLAGPELVTVGDGPVEIRETSRRGGLTVAVASDEVRRHGLNEAKRSRLIRAGADLVVPDFSQGPLLLDLLGLPGRGR